MVVSQPGKQEEATKIESWNIIFEIEQAVFHSWKTMEHLWRIFYHATFAFCKVLLRFAIEQAGKLLFALLYTWVTHHEHLTKFHMPNISM
jgi:hypothetical protein